MLERLLFGSKALHNCTMCSAYTSAGYGARGTPGYHQSEAALPGPGVVACIDDDVKVMVRECATCLFSGKMGQPAHHLCNHWPGLLDPGITCRWRSVEKSMAYPTTSACL